MLSKISGILGKFKVSIASVYQKQPLTSSHKGVPILMLTHKTNCGKLKKALDFIDRLAVIKEKTVKYKLYN